MKKLDKSLVVAEYALGLLNRSEAKFVEQRLKTDSKIREAFVGWSEFLTEFHGDKGRIPPSENLKHNIESRLFGRE